MNILSIWTHLRRLWKLTITKGIISGVLSFIFLSIISGLIEDSVPQWIRKTLIPLSLESISLPIWLFSLITIVLVLTALRVTSGLKSREKDIWLDPSDITTLMHATEYFRYKGFLELVKKLDNIIRESLTSKNDNDKEVLKRLLDKIFRQVFLFFGTDVRTGVIFRPKADDPEWLSAWHANEGHYLTIKKFYIGEKETHFNQRGCAGEAFVQDKAIKFNIINVETGEADLPYKKVFEYDIRRGGPDYLSSSAIPIHWHKQVIGILCLDSKKQHYFSDDDLRMLQVIADKMGDAFFFHNEIV